MSKKAIERYCKAVGRELICLPDTRRELLKGLRTELDELPPGHTDCMAALETHYGKASQTAVEFQEAVSAGERAMALEHCRRRFLLFGGVAVILFLLLVAYIILNYRYGAHHIITDLPIYN